jgi:hypothetical protein
MDVVAWQRNMPRFFAAALLVVVCVGTRTVSAAECLHCDLDARPIPEGDVRCLPREIGPKPSPTPFPTFERDGLHCDFRRRPKAGQHAPSVVSQTPSHAAPVVRHAPATGAGDPGTGGSDPSRAQSRTVDRDVGFDDAFVRRADEIRAGAGAGAGVAAGAGVGPGAGVGLGLGHARAR